MHHLNVVADNGGGAGTAGRLFIHGNITKQFFCFVQHMSLELEVTPSYPIGAGCLGSFWEGAVEAHGTAHGLPVTGRGYLGDAATGYADG